MHTHIDQNQLQTYARRFCNVRRANDKAPHKPILLLTFLELLEKGILRDNRVDITPELVATFKENFGLLVTSGHKDDFTQPFFYLQSDGFWFLKSKEGLPIDTYTRSVHVLSQRLDYGHFSDDLFALLMQPAARASLHSALLDKFFPEQKANYLQVKQSGRSYFNELETYLLNERSADYVVRPDDDETRFVRGGLFKRLVPKVYDYTCAISSMKVIATDGASLVEACHIVPFSISGDDRVTNGIALCPTLHTAFDRGMIAVNDRLRVVVSPALAENVASAYNLRQFHGQPIRLPFGDVHYPLLEHFAWHYRERFKL